MRRRRELGRGSLFGEGTRETAHVERHDSTEASVFREGAAWPEHVGDG